MDKDKRSLLGALGVGTGAAFIPGKWVKPVIESVVLPAHAETTGCPGPNDVELSCESLEAPFGSHSSPGSETAGFEMKGQQFSVSPPPCEDDLFYQVAFGTDGVFGDPSEPFPMDPSGIITGGLTLLTPGNKAFRWIWKGETCTLYWVITGGTGGPSPSDQAPGNGEYWDPY